MSRVAVIGGGLAGLSAAYHAVQGGKKVTLFEAKPNLGGDAVTLKEGEVPLDLGVMFFHQDLYPGILDFARRKGLVMREAWLYVVVHSGDEAEWRTGDPYPPLDAVLEEAQARLAKGENPTLSEVAMVLHPDGPPPLLMAIISAVSSVLLRTPNRPLVSSTLQILPFKKRVRWLSFRDGVTALTMALGEVLSDVRVSTRVSHVLEGSVDGEPFDEVILACPPDNAEAMVKDATPEEALALGSFTHTHIHHAVHKKSMVPSAVLETGKTSFTFCYDRAEEVHTICPFGTLVPLSITSTHAKGVRDLGKGDLLHMASWKVGLWSPNGQRASRVLSSISGTRRAKGRYYAGAISAHCEAWAEAAFVSGHAAAEGVCGSPLGAFPETVRHAFKDLEGRTKQAWVEGRPGSVCMREHFMIQQWKQ